MEEAECVVLKRHTHGIVVPGKHIRSKMCGTVVPLTENTILIFWALFLAQFDPNHSRLHGDISSTLKTTLKRESKGARFQKSKRRQRLLDEED